jgi:hypothetical protein
VSFRIFGGTNASGRVYFGFRKKKKEINLYYQPAEAAYYPFIHMRVRAHEQRACLEGFLFCARYTLHELFLFQIRGDFNNSIRKTKSLDKQKFQQYFFLSL